MSTFKSSKSKTYSKAIGVVEDAYRSYANFTPLEVMTTTEAWLFNFSALTIFALSFYWTVFILPKWLLSLSERLYFYLTGNTISLSLVVSLVMSKVIKNSGAGLSPFSTHGNMSDLAHLHHRS